MLAHYHPCHQALTVTGQEGNLAQASHLVQSLSLIPDSSHLLDQEPPPSQDLDLSHLCSQWPWCRHRESSGGPMAQVWDSFHHQDHVPRSSAHPTSSSWPCKASPPLPTLSALSLSPSPSFGHRGPSPLPSTQPWSQWPEWMDLFYLSPSQMPWPGPSCELLTPTLSYAAWVLRTRIEGPGPTLGQTAWGSGWPHCANSQATADCILP